MAAQLLGVTGTSLPSIPEVKHDLDKVRHLLATLARHSMTAPDDCDDIAWLRSRHRFLRTVLSARAAMRRQRVVDLAQWRGVNRLRLDSSQYYPSS